MVSCDALAYFLRVHRKLHTRYGEVFSHNKSVESESSRKHLLRWNGGSIVVLVVVVVIVEVEVIAEVAQVVVP